MINRPFQNINLDIMKAKKHMPASFRAQWGGVTTLINILSHIERPQDILALMATDKAFYQFINYLWKQLTRVHYVRHYNELMRYRRHREPVWINIFSQSLMHMRKTDPTHNPFLSATEFNNLDHSYLTLNDIADKKEAIAADTYQPLKDYAFHIVLLFPLVDDNERIWFAVYFNQIDYIRTRIAEGSIDAEVVNKPNYEIFGNASLLGVAVKYRNLEIAKLLLEAGANPEVGTFDLSLQDQTPFSVATENNDYAMIALLIPHIDLNTSDFETGLTPFYHAIRDRNVKHIDAFIEAKVDVNFRGNQELSPVMFAMKHHKLKALKRLIVAGADCSELFKLYSYRRYKDFGTKEQHKDLVRAMNEAKLELYIQKTQKRPENHYKHSLTISFFCFKKTFHFGGYSSTEKLKAAEKLKKVLAGKSKETSLNKKKYKGALNNGELKTIYRALKRR